MGPTQAMRAALNEEGTGELSTLKKQYEELVESYQRRSLALASAAHELKTPLSVLSGYIDLLQSQRIGRLTERERYALSEMEANCDRLKHVVNDFLTWAALEKGRLLLQLELGDLNLVLAETAEIWQDRCATKGVQLCYHTLADLHEVMIFFDSIKIQHVVSNLVHNAWKFTPPGGKITIEPELITWERRQSEAEIEEDRRREHRAVPNAVKVVVSDSGPGIGPEFQQEIFDDFNRGPGTGSHEGTGLGLAIVRRIIQAHGGKVWVESRLGEGSKFAFVLPSSTEAAESHVKE